MAAETRKSRKSNFSQEEIDVLVTTVMQNHDILYGETSKSFFHKEIRNQVWNIILEEVNKVSLERRTLNEIKNKWKKCQYNVKTAEVSDSLEYGDCDELDSMPLQQRLSQNHNEPAPPIQPQETVLQSQPISPTKLKVTRQGKPQQQPPPRPPTPPPPAPPQVCLKWNSHHVNMQSAFPNLLTKEQYVDATLFSEGKTLKCHRMILSSCSPYFEEVLNGIGPFQHPVLFMKDIPFWILKALCDFMYAGEVHILQDRLQELLNVANVLKIKGLVGSAESNEDVKPVVPDIKQEVEPTPPPRIPVKEEREEEQPPITSKPARHEPVKPSKKKEDKKSKHASQTPKAPVEEPPPPPPPKAAPKVAPKVVAKVVLPKPPPAPKAAVKNVIKNVLKPIPRPSTSKATHTSRRSDTSRKADKHKAEMAVQKEKEKEKEKPVLKKDNINDPLDLLQPVYEEIAKEEPPKVVKSISPGRGNVQVKKGVNKKVKKRRYAEYAEEREESPPPLFHSRKGTRSRPNVKIPKFFHTHYDDSPKETTDATIVRVPHTDQNDPLIGVEEVEEIKAEPLDMEENTLDVEENLVNYMVQDPENSLEDEEIIGNYDSPLVNIKREPKSNTPNIFKKVLSPQPVIVDIHTVTESGVRLLGIKEENVQIVDISKISAAETIIGFDAAIVPPQAKPSEIIISSVQSMAELSEEVRLRDRDKDIQGESVPESRENDAVLLKNDESFPSVGLRPLDALISPPRQFEVEENPQADPALAEEVLEENLPPLEPDPLAPVVAQEVGLPDHQARAMETDEEALQIKIENVRSEEPPPTPPSRETTECVATSSGSLGSLAAGVDTLALSAENQSQGEVRVCSGSLGSLEAKIETFAIHSQEDVSSQEMQQDTVAQSEAVQSESSLRESADGALEIEEKMEAESEEVVPESTIQCPAETLEPATENIIQCLAETLEPATDNIRETQMAGLENNDIEMEKMEAASEEDTEVPTTAQENAISAPSEPVSSPSSPQSPAAAMNTSESTEAVELEPEVLPAESIETAQPLLEYELPEPRPNNGENVIPDTVASEQVESSETENMVVSQQSDNVCLANGEEPENVEAPSETTINDLDKTLEEPTASEAANNTDSTDNIEAELEQCLASTSNIVPPKPSQRTPPGDDVQRFTFDDDDEDFTKDIELPGFIDSGNKPTEFLEDDFTNDFDMEEFTEEKNVPSVEPKTEGGPDEVPEAPEEIGTRDNGTRTNNDECREKNETASGDKDKDQGPDITEEPRVVAPEELQGNEPTIEENNIDAKIPNNLEDKPDPTRTEEVVTEQTGENLHLVSEEVTSPKSPIEKQEEERPTSYEEEQRLEESLLADLDDDIVMKDATTSQEDDDGTEKTLEMIVNDLNESLGEMRK